MTSMRISKREAKRLVCRAVASYMDPKGGHDNAFIMFDEDGEEYSDHNRKVMRCALDELVAELHRRGRRA